MADERTRVELTDPSRPPQPPPDAGPVTANGGAPDMSAVVNIFPLRIKLQKPIRDKHGTFADVIEFREPTAGDLAAVGDPVEMSFDTGKAIVDAAKMMALMARISNTPYAFIQGMSIGDYETCKYILMRFFAPDAATLLGLFSTATD
jgi:hypothetical protein